MMIELRERCRCGTHLGMWEDGGRWHVTCAERCYDPVDDASPIESLLGRGDTPQDALDDYFRLREDADLEPVYAPTGLASFVVPSHPGVFRVEDGILAAEHRDTIPEAQLCAQERGSFACRIVFEPTPMIQKAANQ